MTFYAVWELPSFTVICLLRFMYVQAGEEGNETWKT